MKHVDTLLSQEMPPWIQRKLLLMHAGMIQNSNPQQARNELKRVLELHPNANQQADAVLQLAQLDITNQHPEQALKRLQEITTESLKGWAHEQELRYFTLLIKASEKLHSLDSTSPTPEETMQECLNSALHPETQYALALNLVNRLTKSYRYQEALDLLDDLIQRASSSEQKARILLLSGRTASLLGSFNGLKKALSYFEACANIASPYNDRARILQASILAWINRGDEAAILLQSVLRKPEQLSQTDLALVYSIQADMYSLEGTEEHQIKAIESNENIRNIETLPRSWKIRATLQHAVLCARANRHEDSLKDYLEVLKMRPASGISPHPSEWYILYYAGYGAISEYLRLKQYEQAALQAEAIATWTSGECEPGPRASEFRQWGDYIRQTHYLPHAQSEQHIQN